MASSTEEPTAWDMAVIKTRADLPGTTVLSGQVGLLGIDFKLAACIAFKD
jgi:hypothetical protein